MDNKISFLMLSVLFLGTISVFAGNVFVSEDGISANYYSEDGSEGLTESFVCVDGSGGNRTLIFENGLLINVTEEVLNESGGPFGGHATLGDNLISYYSLDANANDNHGSNDGTVGGASLTSGEGGIIGEGYSWDGSNDYITTSDYNVFSGSSAWSISWWFKTASFVRTDFFFLRNEGSPRIASGDPAANNEVRVHVNDNGTWVRPITSGAIFSTNTWYNVVVTYDGSGNWEMFVNGASVDTGSTGTSWYDYGTGINTIGQYPTNNFVFNGVMDEIGIWNKSLSSSEVSDLYNSGNGLAYE